MKKKAGKKRDTKRTQELRKQASCVKSKNIFCTAFLSSFSSILDISECLVGPFIV